MVKATEALPHAENLNWRPDGIYQKANLAQLTLDIIYFCNGTTPDSPLDVIDSLFPAPFISLDSREHGLSDEASARKIFEMGLAIRTQRCILTMHEAPKATNSEMILRDIFNASCADTALRGWEMGGLQDEMGDLPDRFHDQVQKRIEKIREALRKDTSIPVDFTTLKTAFPWSEFVVQLAAWVRETTAQINNRLREQEDHITAIAKLRQGLESRMGTESLRPTPALAASPGSSVHFWREARQASQRTVTPAVRASPETDNQQLPLQPEPPPPLPPAAPQRNFISITSIRHLQKLRERTCAAVSPGLPRRSLSQSHERGSVRTAGPAETSNKGDEQTSALVDIDSTPVSSRRTFLNRQANAERVSPIRYTQDGADLEPDMENTRKRRRAEENESEESAFEDRPGVYNDTPRPSKRRRVDPRATTTQASSAPSPRVPRRSQSVTAEAASAPALHRQRPEGVRSRENAVRRLLNPTLPGAPRVRLAWTAQESRQLVRLVRKYGPSWVAIKSADDEEEEPKLANRGQVQLKDRARQMVFDWLRAGQRLPKNFILIGLSAKHIAKLEAMGIDFMQRREESEHEDDYEDE
ncbi:predicted protein [Uncinocarpus reesii 1704]|uniref:Myb-like domain-containing protein n=1 Tax=Uncinocarpus reesii (strain UAMH 1704) TaxID=336963 RepID=C4JE02_UNCRE|nr:uncharacterized protein UREG_00426 [Uncinocarpus reesii 1704]EEP75580.1 predicted protein [Uncinocarpus reesii 1704]